MVYSCCVPTCRSRGDHVKMHRFPKTDENAFMVWLNKICNPKLLTKDPKLVRANHRVCDIHFSDNCRLHGRSGSDLKIGSYPTLHLPDPALEDILVNENNSEKENVQESQSNLQMNLSNLTSSASTELEIPAVHVSLKEISNIPTTSTHRTCQDLPKRKICDSLHIRKTTSKLTPRGRELHKIARAMNKTATRLRKRVADGKARLKAAYKFAESGEFMRAKLNEASFNFIMGQLKLQKIAPKGRRYSLEDKIFALGLLKQSPKGYKMLQKIFALPSRRTVINLLSTVPFKTGINEVIFKQLEKTVSKMKILEKYCTIIFDEISLNPSVQYNFREDRFDGFEDNGGENRCQRLADKAMVFMARGIHKKWKQPLAYYFNSGGMKSAVLSKTLKEVIRAARTSGLKVVATVSDQGGPNRAAINYLYEETKRNFALQGKENRGFGFFIDDGEVVHLYDPPHLLKCIRNNLFDRDCIFMGTTGEMTAKWEHLRKLYNLDSNDDTNYKMLHKITEQHINNSKKMKVSMAAQIFSQRVAALLKGLARLADDQEMPSEASETAEFILFMNKCFDSVNGARVNNSKEENNLRCAVDEYSSHMDFWKEAINTFNTVKFVKINKSKYVPPSVNNWIHTLKGFRYLWPKLKNEGFKFLSIRNFNQDPLENYFGNIRSHGVRNINPTCQSFVNSFKALLINNFLSPHSPGSNCENDKSIALDPLIDFFTKNENETVPLLEVPDVPIPHFPKNVSVISRATLTFIAGYIAKKYLKANIPNCTKCKNDLLGNKEDLNSRDRFIIDSRQFQRHHLVFPSKKFQLLYSEAIYILTDILPKISHKENIKTILTTILTQNIENPFTCDQHVIYNNIIRRICHFHILVWSKNINKILKGKIENVLSKDPIKIEATKRYHIHKKITKKIREMKNLQ